MLVDDEYARDLTARFGSPVYLYDLDQIERRLAELRAVLPASRLLYSLKANALPELGAVLAGHSCGAEISSPGELNLALEAGFEAGSALYTGPGKTTDEIAAALGRGVRHFSCESMVDLRRIRSAARAAGVVARILLRVRPAHRPRAGLVMGRGSRFGFAEAELTCALRSGDLHTGPDLAGLHYFLGSQLSGAGALAAAFAAAIQSARRIAPLLPDGLRVVDLGGGFPWPYAQDGPRPDLRPLAAPLREAELAGRPGLWFESGRYLVASAGTLITRVLDVKRDDDDRTVIVLDAGINTLAALPALGRLLRPQIGFRPTAGRPGGEQRPVRVTGPLCTPLDNLASAADLGAAAPGDLVMVPNVGAYGLSASLVSFLHRTPPAEVVVRHGDLVAARRLSISYDGSHPHA